MKHLLHSIPALALAVSLILAPQCRGLARAQVYSTDLPYLSTLFTDNMVLQRDQIDPIWGWTKSGATVKVTILGRTWKTVASWDGKWVVKVGPISTGKPFDIQVAGPQTVHFHAVSQPSATTPAHWSVCTPITVVEQGSGGGFTAAGYSFTGISLGIRSNMDQRCACRRGLGALEAARVQCAAGSS